MTDLDDLVGHQVLEVYWSEDYLTFVTSGGVFSYVVDGDCCSHSYFHDLIGLEKLLAGPVVSVAEVALDPADAEEDLHAAEDVKCYGFQIFTQHPVFGEVTTAFSFRNASNGYYGGWMGRCDPGVRSDQRLLTEDVL